MLSSGTTRVYVFAFLAFCVLSSKNILIYNEETLVALSFFCFVFFVYRYFGNTISESLDERSQMIQHELQNYLQIKEQSLKELLDEHHKVSMVVQGVHNVTGFTTRSLQTLGTHTQKALENIFIHQLQNKLKNLVFSQVMLQQKLQTLVSQDIVSNALVAYHQRKSEKTKILQKTIHNAIELLLTSTVK